jgi:hypothetical protein
VRKGITASAFVLVLGLAGSFLLLRGKATHCGNDALVGARTSLRAHASGPLRLGAADNIYFTDGDGKAVYLTGSHNWNNLQDAEPLFLNNSDGTKFIDPGSAIYPKFDFSDYLRFLVRENHNFTRLWTFEEAAWVPWLVRKQTIQPLPYARTGPGLALDGKPKFDLTRFDQEYFDRLRSRVSGAGDLGIYVSVMLFDGWSIETKGWPPMTKVWRGHPFHRANNINGVDGDPNGDDEGSETHTLLLPGITTIQESYVRKAVTTLNDLDNVLWEISNESSGGSRDWQYHMIDFIKYCEASQPKQHPVGMTACYPGGSNADLFNSPADWISPSPARGADYCNNPPASTGGKVVISDTDHLPGVERDGAWVWKSFTRGLNPIFMDPVNLPQWSSIRVAMGATLAWAERLNLNDMRPRGDLASTGYCLANPGQEYLIYAPLDVPWIENRRFIRHFKRPARNIRRFMQSNVTLDLSSHPAKFRVEWFDPCNGEMTTANAVNGGAKLSFTAPFRGAAVLHVRKEAGG